MLRAQPTDQAELGLEVYIVRQLQMFDEPSCLHVVAVGNHELFVLGRRDDVLAELASAECAVTERHRHRLALSLSEDEAVASRELWRRLVVALELVDHLAFG